MKQVPAFLIELRIQIYMYCRILVDHPVPFKCVSICDRVHEKQPYVGEINFQIRAFIAISGIY